MLQAAAAAWPADRPPVEIAALRARPLTLAAAGWNEPQIEQFRGQLQPAGWQVEASEGRLVLSAAPAPGARS